MTSKKLTRYSSDMNVSYDAPRGSYPPLSSVFPIDTGPGPGGSDRGTPSGSLRAPSCNSVRGKNRMFKKVKPGKPSSMSGFPSRYVVRPLSVSGPPKGEIFYRAEEFPPRYPTPGSTSGMGPEVQLPPTTSRPPPGPASTGATASAQSYGGSYSKPPKVAYLSEPSSRTPRVLDVIGCHRELTVCGHVDLVKRLPLKHREHLQLITEYEKEPGNYEGRYSDFYKAPAKLLDYGNHYLGLRLYEDLTRPELGEFLLAKGWRMIGFATNKEDNKTYIIEKWCNIRDH